MTTGNDTENTEQKKSSVATRVLSFGALCCAVSAIGWVGHTVYHVANDGFVAPIILSPDSDMVIQSKLSMSQLLEEKHKIIAAKDGIDAELEAGEKAIGELTALRESSTRALDFTAALTRQQVVATDQDRGALAGQRVMFEQMLADEQSFTERMKKDLEAGLVSKSDYARQVQSFNQLRMAQVENERARIVSDAQSGQVRLTQQALKGMGTKSGISTPEMLLQQDQLVRVTCDLLKLQAEQRSKSSERRHIDEELVKIDELLAQLNSRPIFRAIEAKTNVAFVPYTQMEGVAAGATVYDCVWGVFACKDVGKVAELLPGEAIVADPWGTPARGQYAIMDLTDANAATSKTLRVRPLGRSLVGVAGVATDKRVTVK